MKNIIAGLMLGSFFNASLAHTCTRVTYLGPENTIITARSMDWVRDAKTNVWVFARGMKRNGSAGPQSIKWTSKYGSIISTFYDQATADGMNEKGLVANLLYLAESEYPEPSKNEKSSTLGIAIWAQYVLDNFASVEEAVKSIAKESFYVVPVRTPDDEAGTVHLAISDASGDSAIFEYLKGKLHIHHGRHYQVMTNSPGYDEQIALDSYWQKIGGMAFLPGTSRAADRFARASFYIKTVPQTVASHEAVASVLSVIRNASTPMGVAMAGQPNIAPTLWRTVSDQKNKRYYFDSAKSPNIFWLDLAEMNLAAGEPVKKLLLGNDIYYAGNAQGKLQNSEAFEFLISPVAPAESTMRGN